MFRELTEKEQATFRQWARDKYVPGTPISEVWHPVTQAECKKMNEDEPNNGS